jgi:6-phosphogluconolactonase (cycloisomerase 2 family)
LNPGCGSDPRLASRKKGDIVVTFRIDGSSGKLTPTGQAIKNASPVTIVFTGK